MKSAYALKVAAMALAVTVVTGSTPLLTPALRTATFWMAVMKPLRLVDYSTVNVAKYGNKNMMRVFWHLLNHLDGTFIKLIGLIAPGNYSAQFGFSKISVLLCEGPQPPNSMMS